MINDRIALWSGSSGWNGQFCIILILFRILNGARDPEVEEPVRGAKAIIFEFVVDEVAEPKALAPSDLRLLVKKYGSSRKEAESIGASKAFVGQNSKS